ncbi:MAG: DUF975 family protein [Oscillibacter sp.]|jgi:uncharacterized membrane protein|nr:DUF975 family protein [Oscillibacter sp.]
MFDRVTYKANGKLNFKRNYWPCIAVSILLLILGGGGSGPSFTRKVQNSDLGQYFSGDPAGAAIFGMALAVLAAIGISVAVIGIVVKLLVGNPYAVGASRFFMENRFQDVGFGTVKAGFTGNFGNTVLTQFLKDLYIFLWSLLLIIPGIVKGYAYFAVPYILAENPNLDHNRVLELSKAMTNGHKADLWVTDLSFILWYLLGAITIGIVDIFYVNPYVHATKAEIYASMRQQALTDGIAAAEELPGFGEEPFQPQDTPNF